MSLRWRAATLVLVGAAAATLSIVARDDTATHDPPVALRTLDCAPCHAEIDDQWRGSLHARAWSDPIVQAEFTHTPEPSCRSCHAPATAADPSRGIDCAACHVRDEQILAVAPSVLGALIHPMRAEPTLATVAACAGCHQFAFADDDVHDPLESLQDTVAEWRRSTAGAEQRVCQICHMPTMRGADGIVRAGHHLPGLDDADLVAHAVEVTGQAQRRADGIAVRVRLVGDHIGHAFPTGDLFREAVLEVRTDSGVRDSFVLKRWLANTLDPDGDDHHLRTVDDTRVPPPGSGAIQDELWLGDPTATRVLWELRVHRLAPATARARGLAEHVAGVVIASGEFTIDAG